MARHFREATHNVCDLRWQILEEVQGSDAGQVKQRLLQREVYWIYSLESLTPHGLNEECNWSIFT